MSDALRRDFEAQIAGEVRFDRVSRALYSTDASVYQIEPRRARAVAGACLLFEEYVEREWREGRLPLRVKPGPSTILRHGHCHQKSMGLLASARALLSRIPSCSVVDLDAGCGGMAGSGYLREHYDISRRIGERRLLPAAREIQPGTALIASGVSCRQQVADFAGARAVHPAVLLRALVEEAR